VTAAHILLHNKKATFINTRTDEEANDTMEGEANRFAANQLIPRHLQPELARLNTEADVVVGCLQKEELWLWSRGSKLKRRLGLVEADSTAMATVDPAQIPHAVAGSTRRPPQIAGSRREKNPALAWNPQLVRARPGRFHPACHAGGRGFESRRSRSLQLGLTADGELRLSGLVADGLDVVPVR
jgi:hypothetical protein